MITWIKYQVISHIYFVVDTKMSWSRIKRMSCILNCAQVELQSVNSKNYWKSQGFEWLIRSPSTCAYEALQHVSWSSHKTNRTNNCSKQWCKLWNQLRILPTVPAGPHILTTVLLTLMVHQLGPKSSISITNNHWFGQQNSRQ